MENPTKILISGAVLAGLISGGGILYTIKLRGDLSEIQEECKLSGKSSGNDSSDQLLACMNPYAYKDIQRTGFEDRLTDVSNNKRDVKDYSQGTAFTILVASFIPYLWYALLRRIRELSNAFRGK